MVIRGKEEYGTALRVALWPTCLALGCTLSVPVMAQRVAVPSLAPAASSAAVEGSLDTVVRQAVLRELEMDRHLVASGIEVTVRSGIVELAGSVPVRPWKHRAARIARVVSEVRAVVNRIRVVPVARPDLVVQRDVLRAMRGTAALAHMPIRARVDDGVVVLAGAITTWEQQQLAERVASGVPGVRFCQNQLTSSRTITRTPAIISADVRSRLDRDVLVQHAPIEVVASDHRVILVGRVGSRAERKQAISLAWVKGVTEVDATALIVDTTNRPNVNLRVVAPADREIATTIRDLVAYWPWVDASNFSTSVVSGLVTLHGTVKTLSERRALEELARSAVGVQDVRSELRGPWWKPPVSTAPPAQRKPVRRRR